MKRLLMLAALGFYAASAAHAQTVTIVDQSQATKPVQAISFDYFGSIAQSFTPTLSSLNFVTLGFEDTHFDDTGVVNILSGAGIGGTVLGTSQTTRLTNYGFGRNLPTTFSFTTPVVLTPGSQYTISIVPYARGIAIDDAQGDLYTGGQGYAGGAPINFTDLYFAEGLQVAAAPEPSSVAVLSVGILGLGALAIRRRSA